MTDKHTPGPWRADGENVCEVDTDDVIAQPGDNFSAINPSQTLEANAKLIAAAPFLLFALKALWTEAGELLNGAIDTQALRYTHDQARAAIKAAKGDA